MQVEQTRQQIALLSSVGGVFLQRLEGIFSESIREEGPVGVTEDFALLQSMSCRRQFAIVSRLALIGIRIVEACRVEQGQTAEVALLAVAVRSGTEQDDVIGSRSQILDEGELVGARLQVSAIETWRCSAATGSPTRSRGPVWSAGRCRCTSAAWPPWASTC